MEAGELESPSEMTKFSVAVRVRPLIEREKKDDAQIHWQVGPKELRQFDAEAKRIVPNSSTYTYDHVFNQSTQTQQVYNKVVSPIVKQAFKGFNGTILCYGQTSSGKTHTLYGSNDDKGIILLFADHLFQKIKADESRRQYIIKVGLIEIYNEKVTDLLNSYNPIELQERDGSVVPYGLEELTVFDIDDWKKVTERVQRERKIGETRMNKESSRSHTILRVTIESFDLTSTSNSQTFEPTEAQGENSEQEQSPPLTTAVLHFVDLAGSEKQSQTGAEGERFREQVNINKSLSALSHVIQQLSEKASVSEFEGKGSSSSSNDHSLAKAMVNSMVRTAPRSRFINYRDSKLTRLLQSSLSGNAYISMVCNVTIASFEDTKSTLLFAQLAKKIPTRPKQNLCSTKSEYDKKLQELQELLNSKDKEVLVLRRQCENMKRAFEFRDEQSIQRPINIDRRLSLCPTMFRPTSTKPGHSNPEPMTQFAYLKNIYASSTKSSSPMDDEFMSADEFVKSLRGPLEPVRESRESIGSQVISLDKEVQTDEQEEKEDLKICDTPTRPVPRRVALDGTPSTTLRLTNVLLRKVIEEDRQEWEEQKTYLELENVTVKAEMETLKLEKMELEKDVMRQMEASRVEINRRIAESPEALEWKKKLDEELDKRGKENEEINILKEQLKTYYESQLKLIELQDTMSTLILANTELEQERNLQVDRAKETELEHQQMEENLQAIIESKETELRERDGQIKQLQSTLQDKSQERLNLDSDLLEAKELISSLTSAKLQLDGELAVQQSAFEAIEIVVQKLREDQASVQEKQDLERQEKEENIQKLNLITKEHEKCQSLTKDLKTLELRIQQSMSEKVELEERLKQQKYAFEKAEAESQKCQDLITELKTTRDKLDKIIVDKLALEEQLKSQQDAYDEAESVVLKMSEKLDGMEEKLESGRRERDKKVEEMIAILKEHEKCQDLGVELQTARDQLETIIADKVSMEKQLKAQYNAYENAQSTIQRMEKELTSVEARAVAERLEKEDTITKMNIIVKEHEHCQHYSAELKAARANNAALEKRLKAQCDAYKDVISKLQKMKEELTLAQQQAEDEFREKNEKIEELNAVIQSQQKSYEKIQARAHQLKVELDKVEETGKLGRAVVVTRGTQCDDIASELDNYKDATKHYRNRAHKAEFELQRVQKTLEQRDVDKQSPDEPQLVAMELPPPHPPQKHNGTQCILLNEMIEQPSKSFEELPASSPELAQLHTDLRLTKFKLKQLELTKCACDRKPDGKYKKPTRYQHNVAFFRSGSTRMNTNENVMQPVNQSREPKGLNSRPVEEKAETKITIVPPKDLENIEPPQVTPPAEEKLEDDFSWLLELVKKKT
ncbi:unnamed protein product [Orchesella dallaii]|uniref:Kinesin motor domain-containing protein n=1 Tax=Orchesella dallaii TaxID=48710 RepID=A0ABP1SB76_9HEXA